MVSVGGVQQVVLLVLRCKRDSDVNNDRYRYRLGWVKIGLNLMGKGARERAGRRGWNLEG